MLITNAGSLKRLYLRFLQIQFYAYRAFSLGMSRIRVRIQVNKVCVYSLSSLSSVSDDASSLPCIAS